MKVLWSKKTEARLVLNANLNSYMGAPPALVPLDITEETVTELGWRIHGGAGLGGRKRLVYSTVFSATGRLVLNSGIVSLHQLSGW